MQNNFLAHSQLTETSKICKRHIAFNAWRKLLTRNFCHCYGHGYGHWLYCLVVGECVRSVTRQRGCIGAPEARGDAVQRQSSNGFCNSSAGMHNVSSSLCSLFQRPPPPKNGQLSPLVYGSMWSILFWDFRIIRIAMRTINGAKMRKVDC